MDHIENKPKGFYGLSMGYKSSFCNIPYHVSYFILAFILTISEIKKKKKKKKKKKHMS